MGRIKITISEGVGNIDNEGDIQEYHRCRDVVTFSFQHAPRQVLEQTEIAWPNKAMFRKAEATTVRKLDTSAHAHSPMSSSKHAPAEVSKNSDIMRAGRSYQSKRSTSNDDPFVEARRRSTVPASRKGPSDTSMADVPCTRDQSEMSDISLAGPDFLQQVNRAAIDEIVRALTPDKRLALFNALSPLAQVNASTSLEQSKNEHVQRLASLQRRQLSTSSRPDNGLSVRPSIERNRSTSGTSTLMSWTETPTGGGAWYKNKISDYPGLLPSIRGAAESSDLNGSVVRRRKRSLSPQSLLRQASDAFVSTMREMSTSPCKKTPTPSGQALSKGHIDMTDLTDDAEKTTK